MASSEVCGIHTCKRTSRALCHCCQQNLCLNHLKEHSDLLNAQLTPLTDQINSLFHQFNNISLVQPTFLTELDQWHQEAHQTVERYYQRKKRAFEELVGRERQEQKANLDRLRDEINELIQEQEATQGRINSINDSIRSLQQQINQSQLPQFTLSPLIINDQLILVHHKNSNLLPLPRPGRTIKLTHPDNNSIAANDDHLLVAEDSKICLLDREMVVQREISWTNDTLQDMFWSSTLARFIFVTMEKIFTLDEETMILHQCPITHKSNKITWHCGTCSDDNLFLSKWTWGPSIYSYTLRPSIQFVKEYQSPLSCTQDECVNDLSSNNIALALVILNHQKQTRLDLCSPTTLERHWSIQLDYMPGTDFIRCCSLSDDQWLVINPNDSVLLHISADGQLVRKENYTSSPLHAVQFDKEKLAVLTTNMINLHQIS